MRTERPTTPEVGAAHRPPQFGPATAPTGSAARGLTRLRCEIRADRAHWLRRSGRSPRLRRGYHAAVLHRMSRYAYERGWRKAAWLVWIINYGWSGADLPPSSRIGGGLFLPQPHGSVIAGTLGRDACVGPHTVIGGFLKTPVDDIGGGPGLPRLGQSVTLEAGATVLGPIRVGDRARIGPGCLVLTDVAADAEVEPPGWRSRPVRAVAP